MNKPKNTLISASFLTCALLAASPFALADHHGGDKEYGHHGKHNMAEMCENFREGKGPFDHEERRQKMEQRRAEMAERLQLTEAQLEIWEEMHEEQRAKHEQRRAKMQERLQERCDDMKQ